MKPQRPKQATQLDDGQGGFYFQFVEERARYLTGWLQRRGKNLQLAAGDTLREAISKWLIRETLFQSDREIARRAALEYRDLRRAQELFRKNRRNAGLPRKSKEVELIESILRRDLNLGWKQVLRQAPHLKERGLKDRVSRVRARLAEEATQDLTRDDD